jgi:hypothetical protein
VKTFHDYTMYQHHFQSKEAMTGLESLPHVWFDELHLRVNRQCVKSARSDIRPIAVMTKRNSFDNKPVGFRFRRDSPPKI